MSNFWDLLWLLFSAFMFVAYLFVMFQVDDGTITAEEFARLKAKALG